MGKATACLLLAASFCLYSFRLPTSFYPDTDFTRDAYSIIKISQGKLTLLGPALRIGLFAGPYYYYLFAPVLLLSRFDTVSVLYFNALLFSLGLGYFFLKSRAIFGTLLIGLSPFYILAARHPGNAYTYLPLLLVFLTMAFYERSHSSILLGFLAGIIVNFHPLTLLVIVPVFLFKLRHKLLPFSVSFAATFLPLGIFEVKHHFVITTGLLVIGNYRHFFGQVVNPYYYFFSPHLLIVFLAVKYLSNAKFRVLLFIILALLVINFPRSLYTASPLTMTKVESLVGEVISHHYVTRTTSFNLLSITDSAHKVVVGNEYRFAFRKFGYAPLEEGDYQNAKDLLIFSQIILATPSALQTWETQQFGNFSSTRSFNSGNETIYLVTK